ncbi:hypothetical protein HXX76_012085 [Chlamydomonas incerta]|uniref:Uncharacterized protein n=1 Tax=Chlamydomonas incerta TaxID=51695 RepID=A0A835SWD8_CHLIN|nr:hypothetical protein HXX76_012085 [Chlamydomonas incerta]|eukprot:KAG2427760.1 hypothetical protein HXX76_012085 [Chlamydomonas incerta]
MGHCARCVRPLSAACLAVLVLASYLQLGYGRHLAGVSRRSAVEVLPYVLDTSACVSFNADDFAPLLSPQGSVLGYVTVRSGAPRSAPRRPDGTTTLRVDVTLDGEADAQFVLAAPRVTRGQDANATAVPANVYASLSRREPDACPSTVPAHRAAAATACGARRASLVVDVPTSLFRCAAEEEFRSFFVQVGVDLAPAPASGAGNASATCANATQTAYAGAMQNSLTTGCSYILVTAACKPATCAGAVAGSASASGSSDTDGSAIAGLAATALVGHGPALDAAADGAGGGTKHVTTAIAGGVAGGLALAAAVVGVYVMVMRWRLRRAVQLYGEDQAFDVLYGKSRHWSGTGNGSRSDGFSRSNSGGSSSSDGRAADYAVASSTPGGKRARARTPRGFTSQAGRTPRGGLGAVREDDAASLLDGGSFVAARSGAAYGAAPEYAPKRWGHPAAAASGPYGGAHYPQHDEGGSGCSTPRGEDPAAAAAAAALPRTLPSLFKRMPLGGAADFARSSASPFVGLQLDSTPEGEEGPCVGMELYDHVAEPAVYGTAAAAASPRLGYEYEVKTPRAMQPLAPPPTHPRLQQLLVLVPPGSPAMSTVGSVADAPISASHSRFAPRGSWNGVGANASPQAQPGQQPQHYQQAGTPRSPQQLRGVHFVPASPSTAASPCPGSPALPPAGSSPTPTGDSSGRSPAGSMVALALLRGAGSRAAAARSQQQLQRAGSGQPQAVAAGGVVDAAREAVAADAAPVPTGQVSGVRASALRVPADWESLRNGAGPAAAPVPVRPGGSLDGRKVW